MCRLLETNSSHLRKRDTHQICLTLIGHYIRHQRAIQKCMKENISRITWQQITRRNHKDTNVWTTIRIIPTRRVTLNIIQNRWGDFDRTLSKNIYRKRSTKLFLRGRQTESRREIQTPCLRRNSNIAQTVTKPSSRNTITDLKIFNLSARNLTACEIQLLSKGLKYTPTSQRNHHEQKTDIKSYTRRLRLREFCNDECEEELSPSIVQHTPEDLVRSHFNFIPKHRRNRI